MSRTHLWDGALPLGRPARHLGEDEALALRVQRLLETRPGTLPWEREFGCDLDDLVGAAATGVRLSEARWRVQQALARWLPELRVSRCEVRAVRSDGRAEALHRYREVPPAEAALLSLGVQASIEIDLDLNSPGGPLAVAVVLTP